MFPSSLKSSEAPHAREAPAPVATRLLDSRSSLRSFCRTRMPAHAFRPSRHAIKNPKAMPSGLAAGGLEKRNATMSNLLRTKEKSMLPHCAFSHPDSTVGSGFPPDRATGNLQPLAGFHRRSGLGRHSARPHPNPEGLFSVSVYHRSLRHKPRCDANRGLPRCRVKPVASR